MQLQINTLLQNGRYRIGEVLGQSELSITYYAEDLHLNLRVVVEEFFVEECCKRYGDTSNVYVSDTEDSEAFEMIKNRYIMEAKTAMTKLGQNNEIRVYDVFEENGTAYCVMELPDLEQHFKNMEQTSFLDDDDSAKEEMVIEYENEEIKRKEKEERRRRREEEWKRMVEEDNIRRAKATKERNKRLIQTLIVLAVCVILYFIVVNIIVNNNLKRYEESIEDGYASLKERDYIDCRYSFLAARALEKKYRDTKHSGRFNKNAEDKYITIENILEYHSCIKDGDDLSQKGYHMKSMRQYENAQKLEEQYLNTEYSIYFDQDLNSRIESKRNYIQKFTVNGVSFTMIKVENGTFKMGYASEIAQYRYIVGANVIPHQVKLSDYYIGETEVTQELWQAVMGSNPSYNLGPQRPVENVSWNDCQKFIKKLNQLTGRKFRLPTEAEWEFAARGGNKSEDHIFSGSNDIDEVAWYKNNSEKRSQNVKTKLDNELGIHDMSGNVYEWCQDWYGTYNTNPQTNPKGASQSYSGRVLRGGSYNIEGNCLVFERSFNKTDKKLSDVGLRLVLTK